MKRKVLTGIIVILVLLFASCDLTPEIADGEVEYTDVVYSIDENGKTNVTLYLDGVGVPRTAAQRALSKDLAVMSHDFFEVIFIHSGSSTMARASWELGQSAGISGVYRTAGGEDYTGAAKACIFVGRKSDKTLLGIGILSEVDRTPTATPSISSTTKSVTFLVEALHTFIDDNTTGTGGLILPATGITKKPTALGGVDYPLFASDTVTGNTDYAFTYRFVKDSAGGYPTHIAAAKIINIETLHPTIIKREPRYLDGGILWYAKSNIDTDSEVKFTTWVAPSTTPAVTGVPTDGTAFTGAVAFTNTVKKTSYGIFSVVFQIPVANNQRTTGTTFATGASTNGGPASETWFIRPGFGTSLYNIDDGKRAGGCVLFGVGVKALDWIDIFVKGIGLD